MYRGEFDLTADFGIMDVLRISIGSSITEDFHREMITKFPASSGSISTKNEE